MELLILLVEKQGLLVTREEIVQRLWGQDVFVDTRNGINTAVHKLRAALRDDSDRPRILETVVGKGYRLVPVVATKSVGDGFLGTLHREPSGGTPFFDEPNDLAEEPPARSGGAGDTAPASAPIFRPTPRRWLAGAIALAAGVVVVYWVILRSRDPLIPPPDIRSMRSIAVLPFDNLSGDPGQDYFADGMTDELNTNLAKISSLRVVSRTSMMQYRHSNKSIPEIARKLGVDMVVEGSVVRSGDKVRITTQLIDAHRDVHLWAQSYERKVDDILEVQDSIALDIAAQVQVTLSPGERNYFALNRSPIRPNAYDDYLRGRNELSKQNPDAIRKSVEYFQRAIDDDPHYARAYAGMAESYSLLANYQELLPSEAFPKAKAAALKALSLDSDSPEAHGALALVKHHFDWDWEGAEAEYKTALELQPNFPTAHHRYAWFLSDVGRHDEALQEIRQAQFLDPGSIVVQTNLGRVLYRARRYDEAIVELRKAVEMDSNRLFSHIFLGMAYDQKGMCPEALQEFRLAQAFTEGRDGTGAVHAYVTCGKPVEANRALKPLVAPSKESVRDWFYLAGDYAAMGDKDRAFAWLKEAVRNRDFFLTEMAAHPIMDPLRSDPRFASILRQMRFPAQAAHIP